MVKNSKKLYLDKINFFSIILLVIATVVLGCMVLSMRKDIELNRLKENVTSSSLANLRECLKKGDMDCTENKYIDTELDRQALRKFLDDL